MNMLRILLLAPDSNPDSISTSLVGYSHAEALARLHAVTLVTRRVNEEALRRTHTPFHGIEAISVPWLDRISAWSLRRIFKYDYGSHALTAFSYPFCLAFEWRAWRRLRTRIMAGEFDVVLRLLPVNPVMPSPFAFFLRSGPIPFVIGPINGGLPWPQGFSQADKQKEWISSLRNVYRFLPFARSTYRNAAAIIAGSSQTYAEFAAYREKLFFVPENGLSHWVYSGGRRNAQPDGRLQMIFVGRLVPYKACDLALRAAAPLLQNDLARLTVVGDGPKREDLEQLTRSLGIETAVSFCGWLSHTETLQRLRAADVLLFPSVREFGGGVVFEALAVGAVPVVVDFGGPGDVVHPGVGFKVALTTEGDVVSQLESVLRRLAGDPGLLDRLRQHGMSYARDSLSWDAKAQVVAEILHWAVRRGPKPDLRPPRDASVQVARLA
jgi:glycosyltransferase involved in cell wall biosynthesis